MAGILIPIQDFLTKLRTITVKNGDGNDVVPHVRIWNNQLNQIKDGKYPAVPCPAFFVEVVNDAVYENIGQYFRAADLSFRVHIVHEFYDAQDGTFEQDLLVFDLRDKVVANLSGFELTACGPLNVMTETQDYEHDNQYHYILDLACNFIDSIGSKYDPAHPQAYTENVPPATLQHQFTINP